MHWNEYRIDTEHAVATVDPATLYALAGCIFAAWEKGRTVFTCGNGGSASTASHLAQDLAKGTLVPGAKRLRAVCLCDSIPQLTAWANDTSYDRVFAAQLATLGRPGDILIAISGSGNSENVLQAVKTAHILAMRTWGIVGFDGGKLAHVAHRHVHVASNNMGMVEAVHGVVFHWLIGHLYGLFARADSGLSIMDALQPPPGVGEGA